MKRYHPHRKVIFFGFAKAVLWASLLFVSALVAVALEPDCQSLIQAGKESFTLASIFLFVVFFGTSIGRFQSYLEIADDKVVFRSSEGEREVRLDCHSRVEIFVYDGGRMLDVYWGENRVSCIFSDFSKADQAEMIEIFKSHSATVIIYG